MPDYKKIKATSREIFWKKTPGVILTSLIFYIFGYAVSLLSTRLMGIGVTTAQLDKFIASGGKALAESGDVGAYLEGFANLFRPNIEPLSAIIIIALFIMQAVISVGFISFCLKTSRGIEAGTNSLLDGFEFFLKAIGLYFVFEIVVSVLLFFFVVPGIIAALAYSMSFFILIDNPQRGIIECMKLSRTIMKGSKRCLFVMTLSYILWIIASALFGFPSVYFSPLYLISLAILYNTLLAKNFISAIEKDAARFNPPSDTGVHESEAQNTDNEKEESSD